MTEIKEEGYVEDAASSSQQETLSTEGKGRKKKCNEKRHTADLVYAL